MRDHIAVTMDDQRLAVGADIQPRQNSEIMLISISTPTTPRTPLSWSMTGAASVMPGCWDEEDIGVGPDRHPLGPGLDIPGAQARVRCCPPGPRAGPRRKNRRCARSGARGAGPSTCSMILVRRRPGRGAAHHHDEIAVFAAVIDAGELRGDLQLLEQQLLSRSGSSLATTRFCASHAASSAAPCARLESPSRCSIVLMPTSRKGRGPDPAAHVAR